MIKRHFISLSLIPLLFLVASPSQADTLSDRGIEIGMLYIEAKNKLIDQGWTVMEEKDQYAGTPYSQFPEVSCGSGIHAICSVGFQRGNNYLALVVGKKQGRLVVTGDY